MIGVASIEVDGRDFPELTESELAPPAGVALKAMSAVPTDSDALTGLPSTDVGTHGIDLPGNFVARHPGILDPRPEPFFHQHVAMADTTSLYFDAHLITARPGNRAVDHFEISSRLANLHGFHARPRFKWAGFALVWLASSQKTLARLTREPRQW
jgi:hypothetical protein